MINSGHNKRKIFVSDGQDRKTKGIFTGKPRG